MKNISRRHFLKSSCGLTISLPFLPSLVSSFISEKTLASTIEPSLRFITLHNGHCQAVEQWLPNLANLNLNKRSDTVSDIDLAQVPGNLSSILGTSMDSLRSKILILNRLDSTSSRPNHNAEFILSGGVKGDFTSTLDQVISQKISGQPPLNLFVKSVFDEYNSGASHVSVLNGNYSTGDFNPTVVFQRLFANSTPLNNTNSASTTSKRNLLIADRVYQDYLNLKNNSRLSKSDKTRLDQHIDLLYQVETKLKAADQQNSNGASCNISKTITASPVKSGINSDYSIVLDQMFDILELAIKCQKVQVATLMLHVYDYFAGNVGFISGISSSVRLHEDIGHAPDDNTRKMKLALNQFFASKISQFLKNLDVIENPLTNKTYLDNSLVLWANDQGSLKDTGGHTSLNIPVLIAGSAGGFIKSGRYIDYGPAYKNELAKRAIGGNEYGTYIHGRPFNQLLITIAQAMGLKPTDYQTPTNEGFGVYGDWQTRYAGILNHKTEILPFIKS